MELVNLASMLFGRSRAESDPNISGTVEILTATAAIDSASGTAGVLMDCDVTPAEDYDGNDAILDVPTSPSALEGDDLLIGLTGSGPLKTPVVIANPGSGDRMQAAVNNAEALAEAAERAAAATSQHFWHAGDGAHVTEVTEEDWNDSGGASYHSGPNVLLNALGMLLRDGLTNLLTVLPSGVAIYDGNGNAYDNILAAFMANLVRIGGKLASSGLSQAVVQFFDDASSASTLTADHYIDATGDKLVHHDLQLEGTTTDALLPDYDSTSPRSASGNTDVYQEVYNDGTYWGEQSEASITAKVSNVLYHVWVRAYLLRTSAGQLVRMVHAQADTLRLAYGVSPNMSVVDLAMSTVADSLRGIFAQQQVTNAHGTAGTEATFRAARTDTSQGVRMGVGSDGSTRGIYDEATGSWLIRLDASGHPHIREYGEAVITASTSSNVNVTKEVNTSLCSITIDTPGTWLLIGKVFFGANATGRRVTGITDTSGGSLASLKDNSVVSLPATPGAASSVMVDDYLSVGYGESKTRYITVWQNSGSTLSCGGSIRAIRVSLPE